jgi:hypothetical protein
VGASLGLAVLLLVRGTALSALAVVVWGALAYVAMVVAERRRGAHEDERAASPQPAVAPSDAQVSASPDLDEHSARRFEELVEEALRGLNEPGRLAKLELGQAVTRTLASANGGQPPSGLEGGRLLREVVVAAVDRLKPVDADGSPRALQYAVLHEEYVLGRTITAIALRHSVSEQTVFRRRREGIAALAVELRQGEERLAHTKPARNAAAIDYLG